MDAHEIARVLNTGVSLDNAYAQKLIPYSKAKARMILTNAGYTYIKKTKQWLLLSDQFSNTADVVEVAPPLKTDLLPATTVHLNDDELNALKQLAQQIIAGNTFDISVTQGNTDVQLYERTRSLDKGSNTRKTYVIDEAVATRFDAIAERTNLDKSQLLTLALLDFINKYE